VRKDDGRFSVTEYHMPWAGGFGLELDSNGLQRCRHGRACGIVLLIFMSVNSQRHQVFPTSLHQFMTDICADRRMNLSTRHFRMHTVDSHMFSISWERQSIHWNTPEPFEDRAGQYCFLCLGQEKLSSDAASNPLLHHVTAAEASNEGVEQPTFRRFSFLTVVLFFFCRRSR